MKTIKQKSIWKYIFYTYLLFWIMVLGLGGLASIVFHASAATMKWITVLCSWAPTFVLWLMMKKLLPHTSIKAFYQDAFKEPFKWTLILAVPVVVVGIFFFSVWLTAMIKNTALNEQFQIISALLASNIFFTVLQGPSGEESGWRGYLRPEMEKQYGFLKGNIILGLVWAFWHAPLWFVGSEYSGIELVIYIVSVIIVLTSITVIMGVCMRRCNNLFLAFWIHFWFNFTLTFFTGDIHFFIFLAVLYAAAAAGFTALYKGKAV